VTVILSFNKLVKTKKHIKGLYIGRGEKSCCGALWRLILDPKKRGGKLNEITIRKDSSYPSSFYAYLLWVCCLKHQ